MGRAGRVKETQAVTSAAGSLMAAKRVLAINLAGVDEVVLPADTPSFAGSRSCNVALTSDHSSQPKIPAQYFEQSRSMVVVGRSAPLLPLLPIWYRCERPRRRRCVGPKASTRSETCVQERQVHRKRRNFGQPLFEEQK